MADEPEAEIIETEPVPTGADDAQPADPSPEIPAEPVPDPLVEARERAIRAEARAQALQEQLERAPAEARPPPAAPGYQTLQQIQGAFDAGTISDIERQWHVADLNRRVGEQQNRQASIQQSRQDKMAAFCQRFPDLLDKASPRFREVIQVVDALVAEEGLDRTDATTQLRAIERVCGPLTKATPMTDQTRRRIPTGTGYGAPGPTPAAGTRMPDLKSVPAHIVEGWTRLGANLKDPAEATRYVARYQAMIARRTGRVPA